MQDRVTCFVLLILHAYCAYIERVCQIHIRAQGSTVRLNSQLADKILLLCD